MRKPYWRAQSKTWVIKLPNGTVKTLGHDENGKDREHPPKHIADVWHDLIVKTTGNKPGESHKPKDLRLSEVFDAYVESLSTPKTKIDTKRQLDWFVDWIGDIKASQVEVHKVLAYLASKNTWTSTSKATALERITAAINWAIGVQRLDKAYRLEVPRGLKPRRKPRATTMNAELALQLEQGASPELRAILTALRLSGCRPGELCGATIEQFDSKAKILLVLNKTREQTDVEYRPVYLSEQMVALLKDQIGSRKSGFIFLKANGTPWIPRYLSHVVRKLRIKLKLPKDVIPYGLRGLFITTGIEKGIDLITLADMVGHRSLEMIRRHYAKLGKPHLHNAAETMGKIAEKVQAERNKKGRG